MEEKIKSNKMVELDGKTYFYRKCNRATMYSFLEYHKRCEERLKSSGEDKESYVEFMGTVRPSYDRYDYYNDLLSYVLIDYSGDPNEIDMGEAEKTILNFLPESMRLAATLIGF